MREKDHARAAPTQLLDRHQRRPDPRIVSDLHPFAVGGSGEGHVEIEAQQHALVLYVNVTDRRQLVCGAAHPDSLLSVCFRQPGAEGGESSSFGLGDCTRERSAKGESRK